MSLDKNEILAINALVPVATDMVLRLIDLIEQLGSENIDVPTRKRIIEMNKRLKKLEDL